ncbi:unnamed protein product [Peronospora belbahrii]|uniref:Uncharacterized protein n=1 Tax=Peronospora belbahrii TaxID=622444 RepID=A0AAU9LC41_9STRA|nr:unnamed protein product [Peronospora belbahrii]CAH0516162.1 unnamed protein product [Peronospora belbahrii]
MNRLLQHFIDSPDTPSASPSRSSIPIPPQSLGGSYHGINRGSYQRAAPGGPFYYHPPNINAQSPGVTGLDEIPLTSQSTGGIYETVDLNTDTTTTASSSSTTTSQAQVLFTATNESVVAPRRSSFPASRTMESAAPVLFSNGFPPMKERPKNEENPYRRPSKSMSNLSFGPRGNMKMTMTITKQSGYDPMDTNSMTTSLASDQMQTSVIEDPFVSTTHTEEKRNVVENGNQLQANNTMKETNMTQSLEKETGYLQDQDRQEQPVCSSADLFASATSRSDTSVLPSSSSMNEEQEHIPSADSLFGSSVPTNHTDWTRSGSFAQSSQPASKLVEAQKLFSDKESSASSLFRANASTTSHVRHSTSTNLRIDASHLPPKPPVGGLPSPVKSHVGILPSPAKSQTNLSPPPMKPPVGSPSSARNDAITPPMRPHVASSTPSVMKPEEDYYTVSGSMRPSIHAKHPLKSESGVQHMKSPAGKRDDDAISNAPSIALSRMSMRSTLDDSLKLSDMYKQMTARLEGEKHDLLKIVASQAQEIALMKKHIESLEMQLKKHETQDA